MVLEGQKEKMYTIFYLLGGAIDYCFFKTLSILFFNSSASTGNYSLITLFVPVKDRVTGHKYYQKLL